MAKEINGRRLTTELILETIVYLNDHSEKRLGKLSQARSVHSVSPKLHETWSHHAVLCTATETCPAAAGVRAPALVMNSQDTPTLSLNDLDFILGFCALRVDLGG